MPIGMALEQGSKIEIYDIAGYLRCSVDRRDGMVAFSHYWVNVRQGDRIITLDENGSMVDDVELLSVFTPHPWLLERDIKNPFPTLRPEDFFSALSERPALSSHPDGD